MNKTTLAVLTALALAVAAYVVLFGSAENVQAPIVDEQCPVGTTRVGEDCMPLKEACELGGDQYYFDEARKECLSR